MFRAARASEMYRESHSCQGGDVRAALWGVFGTMCRAALWGVFGTMYRAARASEIRNQYRKSLLLNGCVEEHTRRLAVCVPFF